MRLTPVALAAAIIAGTMASAGHTHGPMISSMLDQRPCPATPRLR
jgi:hypothetical protein